MKALELKNTFLNLPVILKGSVYSALSGYVGYLVCAKLKNTAIVKRIRRGE